VDAEAAARGRKLRAQLGETHGGAAEWLALGQASWHAVDDWRSGMFRRYITPLTRNAQGFSWTFESGSGFDAEIGLEEGRKDGMLVAISGPDTRRVRNGNQRDRDRGSDAFYLGAIQYSLELPFRIEEAIHVAYTGTEERDTVVYDVVYATWEGYDPARRVDQYVIWINQETGLLGHAEYTMRDQFKFVVGSAHYAD
jgi:hypothetical protein